MKDQTNLPAMVREQAVESQVPALDKTPVNELRAAMEYLDAVKKVIMKEDVDYGIIPGTKKACLWKPGMEKMGLAFSVAAHYDIVDSHKDFHKVWHYGEGEKAKEVIGFYDYTCRCTLHHKATGYVWASAIGNCNSNERGREMAPANTILKMAEKRAYGLATQNAFALSHIFDVDLEDLHKTQRGNASGGGGGRQMESKYGSLTKPNKCNFCDTAHIITKKAFDAAPEEELDGMSYLICQKDDKWGAVDCTKPKVETGTPPDAQEPPPHTDEDGYGDQ